MSVNKSVLSSHKYSWLSSAYLPALEMQSPTKVMQNVSFLDVSTVKLISNLIVVTISVLFPCKGKEADVLGNRFLRSKERFLARLLKNEQERLPLLEEPEYDKRVHRETLYGRPENGCCDDLCAGAAPKPSKQLGSRRQPPGATLTDFTDL